MEARIPNGDLSLRKSDELEAVREALKCSFYSAHRRILLDREGDVIVLRGVLPNFYLKQIAHTIASKIVGATRISDQIEVRLPNG